MAYTFNTLLTYGTLRYETLTQSDGKLQFRNREFRVATKKAGHEESDQFPISNSRPRLGSDENWELSIDQIPTRRRVSLLFRLGGARFRRLCRAKRVSPPYCRWPSQRAPGP